MSISGEYGRIDVYDNMGQIVSVGDQINPDDTSAYGMDSQQYNDKVFEVGAKALRTAGVAGATVGGLVLSRGRLAGRLKNIYRDKGPFKEPVEVTTKGKKWTTIKIENKLLTPAQKKIQKKLEDQIAKKKIEEFKKQSALESKHAIKISAKKEKVPVEIKVSKNEAKNTEEFVELIKERKKTAEEISEFIKRNKTGDLSKVVEYANRKKLNLDYCNDMFKSNGLNVRFTLIRKPDGTIKREVIRINKPKVSEIERQKEMDCLTNVSNEKLFESTLSGLRQNRAERLNKLLSVEGKISHNSELLEELLALDSQFNAWATAKAMSSSSAAYYVVQKLLEEGKSGIKSELVEFPEKFAAQAELTSNRIHLYAEEYKNIKAITEDLLHQISEEKGESKARLQALLKDKESLDHLIKKLDGEITELEQTGKESDSLELARNRYYMAEEELKKLNREITDENLTLTALDNDENSLIKRIHLYDEIIQEVQQYEEEVKKVQETALMKGKEIGRSKEKSNAMEAIAVGVNTALGATFPSKIVSLVLLPVVTQAYFSYLHPKGEDEVLLLDFMQSVCNTENLEELKIQLSRSQNYRELEEEVKSLRSIKNPEERNEKMQKISSLALNTGTEISGSWLSDKLSSVAEKRKMPVPEVIGTMKGTFATAVVFSILESALIEERISDEDREKFYSQVVGNIISNDTVLSRGNVVIEGLREHVDEVAEDMKRGSEEDRKEFKEIQGRIAKLDQEYLEKSTKLWERKTTKKH